MTATRLAAFQVHDELLVDRLVLHLRIGLHVAQPGARQRVVAGIADHAERQPPVARAQQPLAQHVLQERELGGADAAEQLRLITWPTYWPMPGGQGGGDVVGHAGVVVAVGRGIAAAVVPAAHAPEGAARLRIGDHVDPGGQQRRQFRGRIGPALPLPGAPISGCRPRHRAACSGSTAPATDWPAGRPRSPAG